MNCDAFLDLLWRERGLAIVRASPRTLAENAMHAAVRGGFKVLEFTLGTPDALGLIRDFAAHSELTVGAGTVLTADDARSAIAAGARFLVSPIVDEAVIEVALAHDVAIAPGTATPTEMVRAHRAGAALQKLFPAAAGGPSYVRSVLGPLPFLRIVPTNGVDADNAADYLNAGAFACGFVGSLFTADAMARGDFAAIEAQAARLRRAVDSVTRPSEPAPRSEPAQPSRR